MVKMYNYINVNQQCYPLENKKICIWGRSLSALALYVELQNRGIISLALRILLLKRMKYLQGFQYIHFRKYSVWKTW